jgi:hypothetical protein
LFDENRKYGYVFSGKTTIIAPTGTDEGISEVSIRGRANIIGTQKCGAILYIKHVEITQGGSKVSLFSYATSIFFRETAESSRVIAVYFGIDL